MAKVNLSAPWEIFFAEIEEMFGRDPEIDIKIDHDTNEVKLFVENSAKADALQKLLPETKRFGEVEVKISVVPANAEDDPVALFERAFFGNPAFEFATKDEDAGVFNAAYVVFENRVVQFYCDNLADIYRNRSTLYEFIARDIFENYPGVYFCTDSVEENGDPLPFF